MIIRYFDEIKQELKNIVLAKQKKITDFNEGSVISSICEAVAIILERFYIEVKTGFAQNLDALAHSVFGFKRKEGSKATSSVVFTRNKPSTQETIIPVSTVVSSGNYKFKTTTIGVIASGELDSNKIPVQAEEIGLGYNVSANTITSIDSTVPIDIVSVNNPDKAVGGADTENNIEMQARFKMYLNGLQGGNIYGLKSAILGVEGVHSVSVEEHFPPLENIYGFTAYIDDGTGGLTNELKTQIEQKIEGDGTSVNPGYRVAGVIGRVMNATAVSVDIKIKCWTYRTEKTKALLEIENELRNAINELGINENVVLTSLILRLRRLGYVKDVKIYSPEDNIKIGLNQIARFGSVEIEIAEAE